jgi:hypothetical protein
LSDEFLAIEESLVDLREELDQYEGTGHAHGKNTKANQMKGVYARQDQGLIDMLMYRKSFQSGAASDSFWYCNIPPAAAGKQCYDKLPLLLSADTYVKSAPTKRTSKVRVAGDYASYTDVELRAECKEKGFQNTGSRITMLKYLRNPTKARRERKESDPSTWPTKDIQAFLKSAELNYSGARSTLVTRAIAIMNAPALPGAGVATYSEFTLPRLRVELLARGMSASGSKVVMIKRLQEADAINAKAEMALHEEAPVVRPMAASKKKKPTREAPVAVHVPQEENRTRGGRLVKKTARMRD